MDAYLETIKEQYDLPFLEAGIKITDHKNNVGTLKKATMRGLEVKMQDGSVVSMHPTWETTYFNKDGSVIKDFKESK